MHDNEPFCCRDTAEKCGLGIRCRIKVNTERYLDLNKYEGITMKCDHPDVCTKSSSFESKALLQNPLSAFHMPQYEVFSLHLQGRQIELFHFVQLKACAEGVVAFP